MSCQLGGWRTSGWESFRACLQLALSGILSKGCSSQKWENFLWKAVERVRGGEGGRSARSYRREKRRVKLGMGEGKDMIPETPPCEIRLGLGLVSALLRSTHRNSAHSCPGPGVPFCRERGRGVELESDHISSASDQPDSVIPWHRTRGFERRVNYEVVTPIGLIAGLAASRV